MKYTQDYGEWFEVTLSSGVRQQCCSCSLVHDIDFKRGANGNKLFMRFVRNERATTAARRKHRNKMRIVIDE